MTNKKNRNNNETLNPRERELAKFLLDVKRKFYVAVISALISVLLLNEVSIFESEITIFGNTIDISKFLDTIFITIFSYITINIIIFIGRSIRRKAYGNKYDR
jgi:hypothetical protein